MDTSTEKTHLRASTSSEPRYTRLNSSYTSVRRNRIQRFQFILCTAILGLLLILLFIAVAYSSSNSVEPPTPTPIPPSNTSLDDTITTITPSNTSLDDTITTITPSNTSLDDTITTLLSATWPIQDIKRDDSVVVNVPDVTTAMEEGKAALAERDALEANRTTMRTQTAAYRANRVVSTTADANELARQGFVEDRAMLAIKKILSTTTPLPENASSVVQLPEEARNEYCKQLAQPLECFETPYRSADGKCNNVKHPRTWGVALTPYRRMLPPVYEDGIMKPRSKGLPSAREVSVTVHRPVYTEDPYFTVMLAVWGQFIDHDITATALSQGPNGTAISCCEESETPHPECFPVPLGKGDPYYDKYNVTCMEFVRSAPAPTCSLRPREQLNQATSFLDASAVYGSTESLAKNLREFQGGRLRMSISPDGRELLPVSKDLSDGCNRQEMSERGRYCFASGDGRANENLHLTTMHLLWARHHNRLVAELHELNLAWEDERLYQESRRIVAAQMQHVTYTEFLPVILGTRLMSRLGMYPQKSNYSTDYDPDLDPSICNSFAGSAFRFAHTLLPSLFKVIANDTSSPAYVELHKMLFDPYKLYSPNGTDASLRGALETNIERADTYFSSQVTQHLFESSDKKKQPGCGLDLVSLNVQRGRDHGLPPYPQWRKHCRLSVPKKWSDLRGVIDDAALNRMKKMYKSVNDIDVYTGSLSEIPRNGILLGPTVTCMLADQFLRIKRGDRFWYETSEEPQAFSPEQLAEIRKTSLARIICDTSDGVTSSQPEVMRAPRSNNKQVPCSSLPHPDYSLWKEN